MALDLDLPTLHLSSSVTRVSLAILFIGTGLAVANARHFLFWAAGLLASVAAFALSSWTPPEMLQQASVGFAIYSLHGVSFVCLWLGLRAFEGEALPWKAALGIALVPGLVRVAVTWAGFAPGLKLACVVASMAVATSFSFARILRIVKQRRMHALFAYIMLLPILGCMMVTLLIPLLSLFTGGPAVLLRTGIVADAGLAVFLYIGLFALDAERSRRDLLAMAKTDPLTGLGNRRGVLDKIRQAGAAGTVLMFDIDLFKHINDAYGHTAGDLVLQEFARRLEAVFRRETDVTGRWGGEEFIAFALGMPLAAAMERAEQFRKAVAAKPFDIGSQAIHVTVSVGIAAIEATRGKELAQSLEHADAALYRAKSEGRNRTMALAA